LCEESIEWLLPGTPQDEEPNNDVISQSIKQSVNFNSGLSDPETTAKSTKVLTAEGSPGRKSF